MLKTFMSIIFFLTSYSPLNLTATEFNIYEKWSCNEYEEEEREITEDFKSEFKQYCENLFEKLIDLVFKNYPVNFEIDPQTKNLVDSLKNECGMNDAFQKALIANKENIDPGKRKRKRKRKRKHKESQRTTHPNQQKKPLPYHTHTIFLSI